MRGNKEKKREKLIKNKMWIKKKSLKTQKKIKKKEKK